MHFPTTSMYGIRFSGYIAIDRKYQLSFQPLGNHEWDILDFISSPEDVYPDCSFLWFLSPYRQIFGWLFHNPKLTSFHIISIHHSQLVFNMMLHNTMSWDSSVGIVMGYRLAGDWFLTGARHFSLPKMPRLALGSA
jgi:hypothetical protein